MIINNYLWKKRNHQWLILEKWCSNAHQREKFTRYWKQQMEFTFLLFSRLTEISFGTSYVEINWLVSVLNLKFIAWDHVKIIEVPHIEGLRIPEILEFAQRHWYIHSYLPEYEWEKYPSRRWIWNIGEFVQLMHFDSEFFNPKQIQRLYK